MPDRDFSREDGRWYPMMHQLADALIKTNLSGGEFRALNCIMRQAYSFQKAWADIKWTKFLKYTEMPKGTLSLSLDRLSKRNIITISEGEKSKKRYRINSKISTWKDLPKAPKKGKRVQNSEPKKFRKWNQKVQDSELKGSENGTIPIKKKLKKELKAQEGDLPNQDILNDGSIRKIVSDTNILCQQLIQEGIFPKANAFRNAMMKKNKNERAILHALSRCYIKKTFEKGPWQYCDYIISVEDGNYNERDFHKTG